MIAFLETLPRRIKRLIFLTSDTAVVLLALYFAFALRYGTAVPRTALINSAILFPLLTGLGAWVAAGLGLHRIKLNAFHAQDMQKIGLFALILSISAMALSYLLGLSAPRSVPLIFGGLVFLGAISVRLLGLFALTALGERKSPRTPVAIYGAGAAGIQLASALNQSREMRVVTFVDDNAALHDLTISGHKVRSAYKLRKMIAAGKIKRILVAMPSVDATNRRDVLATLTDLPVEVQTLPSYVEMIESGGIVSALRPVDPNDLLGRDKVDLDIPGVTEAYRGKSILVSGAGGSIGSELCRQLLDCAPIKLVLFDHSEFALYRIDQELRPLAEAAGIELVPVLGSVCDQGRALSVLQEHSIQIVLHAAAYKHVPLVEANELEGLRNNTLGTRIMAEAAGKVGAERFILISTDKAVRPTNIMGASKRLAELMVQDLASRSKTTLYSMVRFGNVLGSSGSVIPLFRDQIAKGGPVTLTHDEVTRYFMTIPEAARLVLLAGSFATGGDVFVLDMGAPVKIYDLAHKMIELSGKTVRNADNPNGDIVIETTGLRPGEKLYEELLIDPNMLPTPHEKILQAEETVLDKKDISFIIKELRKHIDASDALSTRDLISQWVEGYHTPDY